MTPTETITQLKAARDGFWFSLGAYALLTKEPAKSELSRYNINIYEDGEIVVSEDKLNERRGTNYTIGFNGALSNSAARGVVDNSFKQMIIDSNHAIRAYAKFNKIDISESSSIQFIRHYRNAIAHNGLWDLRSPKGLPLTWRNRTLTIEMNNQPIEGFLTWFEGLQLCAQLNIFVTEQVARTTTANGG
ncbi:hypothetical protein [Pseudomonas sediminis]|uniref:hypothetical protein n=1 Tax=Pseudomonas sediminis TaxID=1691904 RepID=UPI00117B6420|nr:hypothetical protein [Pseudomonas sediminis]